jgi:hypothetical protein
MAQAKKTEKNNTVIINLDRPREVRFGHKALKTLSALTGKKINEAINQEEFSLDELEKIMYCGLLSDAKANGETLKLEDMEDLLDQSNFADLLTVINKALDGAFMETEKQKN